MSSEDILIVRPDKATLLNEIGGPFAIISKNPVEDPHNPKGSESILLKTEDGTLLSLRESWADGADGDNTGLTIELFDPDHLFLMQFIDNNSVKVIEKMIENGEGLEAWEKVEELLRATEGLRNQNTRNAGLLKRVKDKKVKRDDSPSMTPVTDFVVDFFFNDDEFVQKSENSIKRNEIRIAELERERETISGGLVAQMPTFYITYGYGKDNYAPCRAFSFVSLDFLHDSDKQGGLRISFAHNVDQNKQEKKLRERSLYAGYTEGLQRFSVGDALVAKISYTDNSPSEVEIDETSDIANLMEYTLQKFIRDTNVSEHIPLVFLSPEVMPRIIEIIDGARNEDPIKGQALERSGSSTPTLLINSKLLSLKKLLESFGFVLLEGDTENEGTKFSNSYFLRIINNHEQSSVYQVTEIIRNIYDKLGITIGSDIVNENMNTPELVKYFLTNFLDGGRYEGGGGNESSYSILRTKNRIEYNNVEPLDVSKPDLPPVHLIGDGLFIKGVLYKLPYKENEKVQDETKGAVLGSNIERFMRINYSEYLELIRRVFVDPVRKAGRFHLPDEYASKLPNQVFNRITAAVPSFLSNTEYSNVISFVATHERLEQSELLSKLDLSFKKIFFKSIKDGDSIKTLKSKKAFSQEQKDELLYDMLNHEFENSDSIGRLLEHMQSGFDAKNSGTSKAYQKVVDAVVASAEGALVINKDYNISSHAMRTYLLYMQKLALGLSKVQAKTTPMFFMAPEFWNTKPCLFLHKKLYTPNSTFQLNREGTFSGIYKILGLEHVISGSECFSSFTILRNALATAEIEKTTPEE